MRELCSATAPPPIFAPLACRRRRRSRRRARRRRAPRSASSGWATRRRGRRAAVRPDASGRLRGTRPRGASGARERPSPDAVARDIVVGLEAPARRSSPPRLRRRLHRRSRRSAPRRRRLPWRAGLRQAVADVQADAREFADAAAPRGRNPSACQRLRQGLRPRLAARRSRWWRGRAATTWCSMAARATPPTHRGLSIGRAPRW